MTPVDIDKLKAEASAVSARCRRANSSRQGDPILLRAADLIDALIAKAERVDAIAEALNGVIPYLDDYLRSIERIDKEVLGHVGQNLALRQAITAARNALSPKESE